MKLIPELKPYEKILSKSIQPYLKIIQKKLKTAEPWQSQAGGYPYLLKDERNPDNLFPLLQVNFEETPALGGFPRNGLLSFYISEDANSAGARFYPQVEKDLSKLNLEGPFPSLEQIWEAGPFKKLVRLTFERKEAPVTWGDYRFRQIFSNQVVHGFYESKNYNAIHTAVWNLSNTDDTDKMGGYASPFQEDPRTQKEKEGYSVVLLQIQNDNFMLNFFIKPESLARLDFSDILFYASCD